MQVKSEKRIQLPEELRFIPKWAYGLAAVAFVVVEIPFVTLLAHQKDALPVPTLALLGLLAAAVVSCYLLLIGYINRDAGRRGMGSTAVDDDRGFDPQRFRHYPVFRFAATAARPVPAM